MTRDEKLAKLAQQYATEFAGNNYPAEFKAQSSMTECNFGSLLIIMSNDGCSCIVWSDWSGDDVDDELKEYEIESRRDPDFLDMEDEFTPGFVVRKGTDVEIFYPLYNFMKI